MMVDMALSLNQELIFEYINMAEEIGWDVLFLVALSIMAL